MFDPVLWPSSPNFYEWFSHKTHKPANIIRALAFTDQLVQVRVEQEQGYLDPLPCISFHGLSSDAVGI